MIRRRCAEATEPPWMGSDESFGDPIVSITYENDQADLYMSIGEKSVAGVNHQFVGTARQDIPKFVAELDARLARVGPWS